MTLNQHPSTFIDTPLQIAVMTADQTHTVSDTDLEDVTELVISVSPNTKYFLLCTLRLTSPAAADIDVTFAAIANTDYAGFQVGTTIKNPVAFGTERMEDTDSAEETIQYYGMFKTGSTGGDLQFQFAQNASNAGNTIIHQGSSILLYTL